MREITTTTKVYKLDELSPDVQTKAVEAVQAMLHKTWDDADNDQVRETIVWELAAKLHAPGYDTYGPGDFPGIDGVTIDGWSLDRTQSLAVSGRLDRVNAPALPWVDGIECIELSSRRSASTMVNPVDADAGCTCSADWTEHDPDNADCASLAAGPTDAQRDTLAQAVYNAVSAAWSAGEKEAEYMTGEERAREYATGNDREFTEDGELY